MSALFPPSLEEQLGRLTPRQRFVYDLLEQRRSDEEIGLWLHRARAAGILGAADLARRCDCANHGEPCYFAASAGRDVLRSLRARRLVKRKRATGLWERAQERSRNPEERSSQGSVIPF